MLLSIANTQPRNIESVRSRDLVPQAIQPSATNFINLVSSYYDYLNTEGLPSNEISSISSLKDIDRVSLKYLIQIEELIGKNVPTSRSMSPIELYKIIVRYYTARGSEDSIHSFFKIFFDQIVTIIYPKERLFNLSAATGSWTGNSDIVRDVTDYEAIIVQGITYSAIAIDGSGQLISVKIKGSDADSYEVVTDYSNGVITITPGLKSRLLVTATDVALGAYVYPVAPELYFAGTVNGRPSYSERLDYVTPWVGTPTRVEWDGLKWVFTIGSSSGDMFAFYSFEDLADPSLVTSWEHGWTGVTGSITALTFANPINGQVFTSMLNVDGMNEVVSISADVLSAEWTTEVIEESRKYLSVDYLPTDVDLGSLAIVNSKRARPYVFGIASLIDNELVWELGPEDVWTYVDNKSFASHEYRLFDGHYWQDYSYEIKSDLDSGEWHDDYMKFVHPAGLKLFSSIVVELIARNEWFNDLNYTTDDIASDDSWMKAFIPPYNLNHTAIGFHSPRSQPGYLREKLFKYLYTYLFDLPDELTHEVWLRFKYIYGAEDVRNSFVRAQYQATEKFVDTTQIGAGFFDVVINDADAEFDNTNTAKLYNMSAFIGNDNVRYGLSYYDTEMGSGVIGWDASSIDDASGLGDANWDPSSFENL